MNLLFFLSAWIAETIGTMVGFGSSTILLPIALLFFNFQEALVLVAFFHIFGNISRISFFRHGLDKNLIIKFGIPSIVLTLVGALLVSHIQQSTLKGILGLFLLFYAVYSFWKADFAISPTIGNAIVGGGLSGFLAGLIGAGGALRGVFLTGFKVPKEKYIATAAVIALAVDLTRIPVYLQSGFLDSNHLLYLPVLLPVALAGSFTGQRIVTVITQRKFRYFVLFAIMIIGTKFIYDWLIYPII